MLGGEKPVSNIPNNCVTCPFETSCNTAMFLPDCHFYNERNERNPLMTRLKNLFGKVSK